MALSQRDTLPGLTTISSVLLKQENNSGPLLEFETAFALSESEQGLKICSLLSHLNALTAVPLKEHHLVLLVKGLWLWFHAHEF